MLSSTSLLNLIILVGFTLYARNGGAIFLKMSIALAFIQFISIVLYSMVTTVYNKYKKHYNHLPGWDEMFHERIEDSEACEENENNLRNTVTAY